MHLRRIPFVVSFASVIIAVAPAIAQHDDHDKTPGPTTAPAQQPERKSDPYLLDTCIVSGQKLGAMGDAIVKVYEGREVRFCCGGCIKKFEADSEAYWEKVDAQIIKRQTPFYPTDTCIVSGEELGGEMGAPIDFVYNNRLVRFCCKGCKRDFLNDSNAFLNKLDEAVIAKQRDHYPLQTCPVSGEALDTMGDPIEMVYGNRLVKLCCKGCIKKFEKDPTTFVAAIDKAWMERHGSGAVHDGQESDSATDHGAKHGDHGDGGHGG